MRDSSFFCYIRKGAIFIVVIKVPRGFLAFGESFYSSAIPQENIGPSVVIVVEDYRTHASTFDQEHIMIVVPVHIKCRQASLTRDILKVDCVRLDGCLVVFRCIRDLRKRHAVAHKTPGSRNTPDPFLHPSDLPRNRDPALVLFARRFMDALRRGIASDHTVNPHLRTSALSSQSYFRT